MRSRILLIAGCAIFASLLAYELTVTKSNWNDKWSQLDEMQTLVEGQSGLEKKGDMDGDGFLTNADVSQIAGKAPKATVQVGEKYVVETYSWRRSLPFMSYDIHAIYRKGEERNTLYAFQKQEFDESRLPAATVIGEIGSVPNPTIGGMPTRDESNDESNEEEPANDEK